jgi:hypothetical protein
MITTQVGPEFAPTAGAKLGDHTQLIGSGWLITCPAAALTRHRVAARPRQGDGASRDSNIEARYRPAHEPLPCARVLRIGGRVPPPTQTPARYGRSGPAPGGSVIWMPGRGAGPRGRSHRAPELGRRGSYSAKFGPQSFCSSVAPFSRRSSGPNGAVRDSCVMGLENVVAMNPCRTGWLPGRIKV